MLAKLRAAGLVWPTLMTLIALPILIGLGTWQVQRKTWKEGVITRLKAGATAAPIPLADLMQGGVDATSEFRRVSVKGEFQHAGEFHVWAPGAKGPAWSIVTPLRLAEPIGRSQRYPTAYVLVIRGVVDDAHKAPRSRPEGQIAGPLQIVGRVRLGGKPWFTTPDVTAQSMVRLRSSGNARALGRADVGRFGFRCRGRGNRDDRAIVCRGQIIGVACAGAAAPAGQPQSVGPAF